MQYFCKHSVSVFSTKYCITATPVVHSVSTYIGGNSSYFQCVDKITETPYNIACTTNSKMRGAHDKIWTL